MKNNLLLFVCFGFFIGATGCTKDEGLCVDNPDHPLCACDETCSGETPECDAETKSCVECLPGQGNCGSGLVCNGVSKTCEVVPCENDDGCDGELICNTAIGRCESPGAEPECSQDSGCMSAAYPACVNEKCRECSAENDSACGDKEKCDVATSRCVVQTCADKTCPMGWDCDEETLGCFECKSDVGCDEGEVCNPATLSCVGCLNNNDCPSAEASRCEVAEGDNQFTCQPCGNNVDCTGTGFPFCVLGECKGCIGVNEGCAEGLICNGGTCELPPPPSCTEEACQALDPAQHCAETGRCVSCFLDQHCDGDEDLPVCNQITNTCVRCVDHKDCEDPNAAQCQNNECVPCSAPEHCTVPTQPFCENSVCVQCTENEQCPEIPGLNNMNGCDIGENLCVQCRREEHCGDVDGRPGCNEDLNICVQCTRNDHCPVNIDCNRDTNLCQFM